MTDLLVGFVTGFAIGAGAYLAGRNDERRRQARRRRSTHKLTRPRP